MEGREAKEKCLDGIGRCSCSRINGSRAASHSGKQQLHEQSCYYKAVEFTCRACVFCVCCPLSVAWCCIKLPCKVGRKAFGSHRGCCRLEKRTYASYSSFSDIDSDDLRSLKEGKADQMELGSSTKWSFKIARNLRLKSSARN